MSTAAPAGRLAGEGGSPAVRFYRAARRRVLFGRSAQSARGAIPGRFALLMDAGPAALLAPRGQGTNQAERLRRAIRNAPAPTSPTPTAATIQRPAVGSAASPVR